MVVLNELYLSVELLVTMMTFQGHSVNEEMKNLNFALYM